MNTKTTDEFRDQLERLIEIGIALSAELDLLLLLEKIVGCAREMTHADAGTLYLLKDNKLHFRIVQNETLGIFYGGKTGKFINLDPVPLTKSNVSAYVALTGETVNIEDVYESEEFDFTGPRKYDAKTGYRSKSMLVVPMKNHEGEIIGVLQLMNAKDKKIGTITAFPDAVVDLTRAFASQAAVALENAHLIKEIKDLFESLIQVLAVAVDAKSPYTGNHVQRVAMLNVSIAQAINEADEGPFADVFFNEQEMEEIRLAGWLHDVGKVTTPVWVMDKSRKLETIFDRIELIKTRFGLIKRDLKIKALEKKVEQLSKDKGSSADILDKELESKIREIDNELVFIIQCDQPGEFMEDDKLKHLAEIAKKTYTDGEEEKPYLSEDELCNLSIRKGSLTPDQIGIMRDHVEWTIKMLEEVPFLGHLKNVPLYAGQHHERLDGKGYPRRIKSDELPLQSRILAIADVYEALSAKDRPYKKPMPEEMVLKILSKIADNGEIDSDLLDLIIKNNVHKKFEEIYVIAQKEGKVKQVWKDSARS